MTAADGAPILPAERVLVGLCHDLNDRLAVLHGLLHLGTRDGSVTAEAVVTLGDELERMEVLVARLRQLVREPDGFAEALIVPELLDEALELLRHHPDRAQHKVAVSAPSYLPPVRADRAALRALLLAGAALTPDAEGTTVSCAHDGDDVLLSFPLAAPPAGAAQTVGALATALGVRAAMVGDARLELRLRSLLAAQ